MRKINVIGIGAGSARHLTLEAIEALKSSDVVVAIDKGDIKSDLLGLRIAMVSEHAPDLEVVSVPEVERDRDPQDYKAEVERWHQARAEALAEAIAANTTVDGTAAMLVWGDPSLYDSTLRMIDRMRDSELLDLEVQVIPGITAVQALTAAHAITLNRIGESICISTGRQLPTLNDAQRRNCVIMLDGGTAWMDIDDRKTHMWWGAYLGTANQVLREGPLLEVGPEIAKLKAELREQHGWIMDTYLLRDA